MVMTLAFDPTPWATAVLSLWLAAIAWIDTRTFRIPDLLSLPLIGLGLLWSAAQPAAALWSAAIGACVGYASLALIGELHFRRKGTEGLGLGDAKLFASAGAWLGWQGLPLVLLIAATAGLIFALVRTNTKDRRIAFGPWLALGLWAVWLWQAVLPATL